MLLSLLVVDDLRGVRREVGNSKISHFWGGDVPAESPCEGGQRATSRFPGHLLQSRATTEYWRFENYHGVNDNGYVLDAQSAKVVSWSSLIATLLGLLCRNVGLSARIVSELSHWL